MLVASSTTGATAYFMRDVTNTLLNSKNFNIILLMGIAVIALYMLNGFATYGHMVFLQKIGNDINARVQKKMFAHLVSLKADYFDNALLGDILTNITQAARASRMIIEIIIMSVFRDMITLIFLVGVMFVQSPFLALIMLTTGPLAVLFIRSIIRKIGDHVKRQLNSLGQTVSILKESVSGIMMIKTYTLEEEMKYRMNSAIDEFTLRSNKIVKLTARTSPIMETLGGIAVGLAIIYIGWWSTRPGSDFITSEYPGQMMSFFMAFLLAYAPAKRLARLRITIEPFIVASQYMNAFFDHHEPELVENFNAALSVKNGKVIFQDVKFEYRADIPVLRGISLEVHAGERVALVGHSGSGKSTIFKLLLALYKPTSGIIEIDGQDISHFNPHSIRKNIAYVGQEAHIFTGTIRENIHFGDLDASQADIEHAAKIAHAHEFITTLPKGYDEFVGENGIQLSGGQRQRLAIARAFLKNASIILLDEATSALDSESEKFVQNALNELLAGRTTFVIAHRLSTVQSSDHIFVLKAGEIIEAGSHDALLKQDGAYKKLYEIQFQDGTVGK